MLIAPNPAATSLPAAFPEGPLWLVGCGAMGGALLSRWLAAGLSASDILVIDPAPRGLPPGFSGTVAAKAAGAVGRPPSVVVLGVKPQQIAEVAADIASAASGALLVSMLAGVRTATLAHLFAGARISRIMPNMPARIGRGLTTLYGPGLEDHDRTVLEALFGPAGATLWIDDEGRFDAVTALAGSGPAFLFRFIEALAGAGEAAGLEPEMAARMALQTVSGAAELAATSDLGPGALRQQVTSPNGTTQAGLDVLDGDGALSSLLRATIRAAAERSRALATAAEAAIDLTPSGARGMGS